MAMRIALVTETFTPEINGVAKTLERLSGELASRGHELHIIRPRQKNEVGDRCFEHTCVRGLPIPGYPGLQFGLPAGRRLRRLWRENRPDIVYVATEGPLGASAVNAANRLQIPVISGFHTNFHSYSRHYRLGWLERIIFTFLKNLHNKTRCTLAPSPELVEALKRRGISETELFSRGVDTATYSPQHRDTSLREQWQAAADTPVALYVGRIAAEKNIELVVRAYRAMQRHRPDTRLVMVGDGPLRKKLRQQHPDIIFTGPKTGRELSRHYASADVFLFGSETETFGNVVLEAMSSGLAVVAYDYAATRMHIRHRVNGLSIAMGDATAFCDAAASLAEHPETVEALSTEARNSAEKNDWTHVIDHFEKVLVRHVKSDPDSKHESEKPVSADGPA